jgi:Rrf2 family iron-sulfur cluster assembly transcriptional regulator
LLSSLVDEQRAKGVLPETRPTRRAVVPVLGWKSLRSRVPNSVFAFGRSFAET